MDNSDSRGKENQRLEDFLFGALFAILVTGFYQIVKISLASLSSTLAILWAMSLTFILLVILICFNRKYDISPRKAKLVSIAFIVIFILTLTIITYFFR